MLSRFGPIFLACGVALFAQAPDLIVHNARIVTVDPQFRIAQAMAIQGDRIVAVGANAEVLAKKAANTKTIDLGGQTVLPGLIDSHVHATGASMYEFDHDIPTMETIADVLRYIKSRAAVVPKGEWISLSQVFITRLREQRYPTRAELDAVAPDHPVIFSTGPDASVNSLALKVSGITKGTQPPPGRPGKVEFDPRTGEPTGILRTWTQFVKNARGNRNPTQEDRLKRLKMMLADYNAVGLTSISERNADDADMDLYNTLRQRNELTCRVFLSAHIEPAQAWEKVQAELTRLAKHPLHKQDSWLWLRGVKAFMDGGMLTGSAFMREPWGLSKIYSITDPNYRGMRYIEPEPLYRAVKLALQNDLQFTAHSQGDAAVHALVDAYERVNRDFPVRPGRPCVTHGSFMSPEVVEKMAAIGVVVDMQPAWLERDGGTLREQFGEARMRYFHPYKSLFAAGVTVGGGSDHMQKIGSMRSINPYNPFYGMWVTLARQPRWTKTPLHTEERISREQAIRLYTTNNAFLLFGEKEKGSLEAGKLADFIVLDRNILTCPLDQVKDIAVAQTWVGGKQVYQASRR